jgi:hypothetical protein
MSRQIVRWGNQPQPPYDDRDDGDKVITYVPLEQARRAYGQSPASASAGAGVNSAVNATYRKIRSGSSDQVREAGILKGWLRYYTDHLGMNFTLVLLLSLCYQAFVAFFIAGSGLRQLPFFKQLPRDEPLPQILSWTGALIAALVIQGLLIAELAQVVWLRRPDRLKVRLMSDSVWWWIMLVGLVLTATFDFGLLMLAITGQSDLAAAWDLMRRNQANFFTIGLLALLNILTLLRCASVMKTSTSEEIRQEVEERLRAIAEEMLLDAADSTRHKATKVWKNLSVDPHKFVPLSNAVLDLVSQQHPDLVPPDLGGDSWAYDPRGNSLVVLPPEVHQALMNSGYRGKGRGRGSRVEVEEGEDGEEGTILWRLGSDRLAQYIGHSLQLAGRPRLVDATNPDDIRYLSRPVRLPQEYEYDEGEEAIEDYNDYEYNLNQRVATSTRGRGSSYPRRTQSGRAGHAQAHSQPQAGEPVQHFVRSLAPTEKALFAAYLTNTVFPNVHGQPFPAMPDLTIWEVFDRVELEWYYRYWKNYTATRQGQPNF